MARDAEPIVWANEAVREAVRRENGRRIVEKFPQSAEGGRRWERFVDGAGNIMHAPTTNCGSIFDLDDPAARDIKRKQRALGVFPLRSCPVALVMAGEIGQETVDASLHGAVPCAPDSYNERRPCPHALKEAELRRLAHAEEMRSRFAKLKSDEERMEEMTQVARDQTKELVQGLTGAITGVLRSATEQGATAPSPAAPPPGEKKGK